MLFLYFVLVDDSEGHRGEVVRLKGLRGLGKETVDGVFSTVK